MNTTSFATSFVRPKSQNSNNFFQKTVKNDSSHTESRKISKPKPSPDDQNKNIDDTDKNTDDAIEVCKDLGRLLGVGRISVLSPKEHDKMIGFVSQLTHVIAVSLMTCSDNTHLVDYTGDSFRDLTRIARINDTMWSELFSMNKEALTEQIDVFMKELGSFREMIDKGDIEGMRAKMRLSTERRALFDDKRRSKK